MIKYKKGQAAMEFLMTYGWAILAAIIVVGVLWYLIGNPSNLAGTQIQLSAPFSSGTAVNLSTSTVYLEFRNCAADYINVTYINVSNSCGVGYNPEIRVPVGALQNFSIACVSTSGSRFSGNLVIYYKTGDGTVVQQATGTINGKVP